MGRKSKNSATADLEFFMKCEVHSSDLDAFINSLKRVADNVCPIPEEKGERLNFIITLKAFPTRSVYMLSSYVHKRLKVLKVLNQLLDAANYRSIHFLCLPSTSQFPGFPGR